jgi:hypothetical protein
LPQTPAAGVTNATTVNMNSQTQGSLNDELCLRMYVNYYEGTSYDVGICKNNKLIIDIYNATTFVTVGNYPAPFQATISFQFLGYGILNNLIRKC